MEIQTIFQSIKKISEANPKVDVIGIATILARTPSDKWIVFVDHITSSEFCWSSQPEGRSFWIDVIENNQTCMPYKQDSLVQFLFPNASNTFYNSVTIKNLRYFIQDYNRNSTDIFLIKGFYGKISKINERYGILFPDNTIFYEKEFNSLTHSICTSKFGWDYENIPTFTTQAQLFTFIEYLQNETESENKDSSIRRATQQDTNRFCCGKRKIRVTIQPLGYQEIHSRIGVNS